MRNKENLNQVYLHLASTRLVTRRHWLVDATMLSASEGLAPALLIVHKEYKDVIWC